MKRAEELAVSYSYVRPNGQRDFTILAENGISDVSIGEKICTWKAYRDTIGVAGSEDGIRDSDP